VSSILASSRMDSQVLAKEKNEIGDLDFRLVFAATSFDRAAFRMLR